MVPIKDHAVARAWGRLFVLGVGGKATNRGSAGDFRKPCRIEANARTDNRGGAGGRVFDDIRRLPL